ncbi:MAG: hypothetical protein U0359_12410 [Byssovorax sp.]
MGESPYRSRPRVAEPCALHAEEPAADRCARCGDRLCIACTAFFEGRAACARCARRHGALQRLGQRIPVLLGLALASAIAVTPIFFSRDPLTGAEIVAAQRERAIRTCDGGELAYLLCDLDFNERDDMEIVTLADRFTEACGEHAYVRRFAERARARMKQR